MKSCSVPGCGRAVIAKGYCVAHYQRIRKHGQLNPLIPVGKKDGELNPKWKGGERKMGEGRVRLYAPDHPYASPDHYVLRYRIVMEKKIGRYLLPGEIVHHINGNPGDDRPENLDLHSSQSEHARVHYFDRGINEKGQFHVTP